MDPENSRLPWEFIRKWTDKIIWTNISFEIVWRFNGYPSGDCGIRSPGWYEQVCGRVFAQALALLSSRQCLGEQTVESRLYREMVKGFVVLWSRKPSGWCYGHLIFQVSFPETKLHWKQSVVFLYIFRAFTLNMTHFWLFQTLIKTSLIKINLGVLWLIKVHDFCVPGFNMIWIRLHFYKFGEFSVTPYGYLKKINSLL